MKRREEEKTKREEEEEARIIAEEAQKREAAEEEAAKKETAEGQSESICRAEEDGVCEADTFKSSVIEEPADHLIAQAKVSTWRMFYASILCGSESCFEVQTSNIIGMV